MKILRTLILFIIVVAVTFMAGSLLSYPVFLILSTMFEVQFHKVIHFTTLLIAIGFGLYYLKLTDQSAVLGIFKRPGNISPRLFTGFIGGIILVVTVELSLFILGMRQIDPDLYKGLNYLSYVIIRAILSGVLVGIAEEILFRGVIFTGLAKYSGNFFALTVSSLFYAGVHFIDFPSVPVQSNIDWFTGLATLATSFVEFRDPGIYDSLLSLFVLGILFSMIRWKTGNIIVCTGLHAGIVTVNKIFSYATDYREGSPFSALVNTFDHQTGHLTTFWLTIACLFYYYRYIRKNNESRMA